MTFDLEAPELRIDVPKFGNWQLGDLRLDDAEVGDAEADGDLVLAAGVTVRFREGVLRRDEEVDGSWRSLLLVRAAGAGDGNLVDVEVRATTTLPMSLQSKSIAPVGAKATGNPLFAAWDVGSSNNAMDLER